MRAMPRHSELSALVRARAADVFEHLDDHSRLASHMEQSSWRLGGGRMQLENDSARGRRVGSRIRLSGRVFGLSLSVEEFVTERVAPLRKTWETIDNPRLLVIGPYRMGFEIKPLGDSSHLRVFIDYDLPQGFWTRLMGLLLGNYYARWCVERMVADAVRHFEATNVSRANAVG